MPHPLVVITLDPEKGVGQIYGEGVNEDGDSFARVLTLHPRKSKLELRLVVEAK